MVVSSQKNTSRCALTFMELLGLYLRNVVENTIGMVEPGADTGLTDGFGDVITRACLK